ncbi:MAG: DUF1292 domain-containing protein [Oscillospiraceae bacterium]|nr:DUF1292 domain-containing protein [Oscillospiraceae bacterium]
MSDEFGGDIITLTDEDGQSYEFEHVDTLEHNEETYMAFIPADIDDEDGEVDFIILRVAENDGEDDLVTVEDDAELEEVYALFMKRIEEYEEETV